MNASNWASSSARPFPLRKLMLNPSSPHLLENSSSRFLFLFSPLLVKCARINSLKSRLDKRMMRDGDANSQSSSPRSNSKEIQRINPLDHRVRLTNHIVCCFFPLHLILFLQMNGKMSISYLTVLFAYWMEPLLIGHGKATYFRWTLEPLYLGGG